MGRRFLTGGLALCLWLAGPLVDAVAGPSIVPIAGLAGGEIEATDAVRTDDGGAVVVARLTTRPGAARGTLVAARLQADGALNLAYGTAGLSRLPADPRLQPTSLAIDPATGGAWIGARLGRAGRAEIVALDAGGTRARAFGDRGILRLPAADDGGVVALAWTAQRLLVAAGNRPCGGCSLSLRDPRTGRAIAAVRLAPTDLAGPSCGRVVGVSAAVFVAAAEYLTTRTSGAAGCGSTVVALGPTLHPLGPYGAPPPPLSDRTAAPARDIATADGTVCLATTGPSVIEMIAAKGGGQAPSTPAGAGSLLALVPLGGESCAALIGTSRSHGVIAQMSAGDRRVVTDRLPPALRPLAMFRCHRHLLVIGAERDRNGERGVIAAVAVRRGPYARAHAASARGGQSETGCVR